MVLFLTLMKLSNKMASFFRVSMLQQVIQALKGLSFGGNLYSVFHHSHSLLSRIGLLPPEKKTSAHTNKPSTIKPKKLSAHEKQLRNMRNCNDVCFILIGTYSAYLNTTTQPFYPINAVATGLAFYDLYEKYQKNKMGFQASHDIANTKERPLGNQLTKRNAIKSQI